jgi:hypothetical protein
MAVYSWYLLQISLHNTSCRGSIEMLQLLAPPHFEDWSWWTLLLIPIFAVQCFSHQPGLNSFFMSFIPKSIYSFTALLIYVLFIYAKTGVWELSTPKGKLLKAASFVLITRMTLVYSLFCCELSKYSRLRASQFWLKYWILLLGNLLQVIYGSWIFRRSTFSIQAILENKWPAHVVHAGNRLFPTYPTILQAELITKKRAWWSIHYIHSSSCSTLFLFLSHAGLTNHT